MLSDGMVVVGGALIVAGVALVSIPAAFVMAGVMLVAFAWFVR